MKNLTILRNINIPKTIIEDSQKHTHQIVDYLTDKNSIFDLWFGNLINQKIVTRDSWINYTHTDIKKNNKFDWHNEKGVGGSNTVMDGEYSGIIWISGDVNCGGSLGVMVDNNINTIEFLPNTALIFNADVLHRVNSYTGKLPRVSLNFTFDIL